LKANKKDLTKDDLWRIGKTKSSEYLFTRIDEKWTRMAIGYFNKTDNMKKFIKIYKTNANEDESSNLVGFIV